MRILGRKWKINLRIYIKGIKREDLTRTRELMQKILENLVEMENPTVEETD